MFRVLSKLGLRHEPRIKELVQLGAAIQTYRARIKGPGRSTTRRLTRSSALYTLGQLDSGVWEALVAEGMDWKWFAEMLGLTQLPPATEQDDVTLHETLLAAITRLAEDYEVPGEVGLPEIALAIIDSAIDFPDTGQLPKRLGELSLRLGPAQEALLTLTALRETTEEAPRQPPLVYLSSSKRDDRWAREVLKLFEPYSAAGRIRMWSDYDLPTGSKWADEIGAHVEEARAAILLISADYLASENAQVFERQPLLERREKEGVRLFPLLVRPAAWEDEPWLAETQIFPPGVRPLQDYQTEEAQKLLADFARQVVELVGLEPGEAEQRSKPPPIRQDRVPTHSDDPSEVDLLNRRPFAEVIAIRISELHPPPGQEGETAEATSAEAKDRSFAVHLHGPWGAGKTSVLNFIKVELESGDHGRKWVVAVFNAWQHQRLRPPWWSLIRQVYSESRRRLWELARQGERGALWAAWRLRWHWWVWRLRADLLPGLLAFGLIAVVVGYIGKPDTGMKVVATLLAAGAGALALGRTLLFGSAQAAESYMSISRDPMSPISALFGRLVMSFKEHPLAVFVDDLDRCDSDFVVELLEGIQTLFRDARVTYVVMADRKWIRSSFEQQYPRFSKDIAEPGRPLGYLFLEKMFQISAPLPRLSGDAQSDYWAGLLAVTAAGSPGKQPAEENARRAEELISVELSPEQMEAVIDEHKKQPLLLKELRTVAAKRMSSQEVKRKTAHFLQPFAPLLEPNPRAMKRLVNAYGIHQAVNFLEGRRVDPGALARWCILEMRWPELAEVLADEPELVAAAGKDKSKDGRLAVLLASDEVERVVNGETAARPLGVEEIELILGSWTKSRQGAREGAEPRG